MRTVLVYDLHASENGALAILKDFYEDAIKHKNINWVFIVSNAKISKAHNVQVLSYPWVKKSWFHRLFFQFFIEKKIIKEFKPSILLSLQNFPVSWFKGKQMVYLHQAIFVTDLKFSIKKDGIRIWLYQKIAAFTLLKKITRVSKVIVQTQWMKEKLLLKSHLSENQIAIVTPAIPTFQGVPYDILQANKTFFYPASPFSYKNHHVILEAVNILKNKGYKGFQIIFTITSNDNNISRQIYSFVKQNGLLDYFQFIGQIPRERCFKLYSESTLIFPSLLESYGLPVLEARLSNSNVVTVNEEYAHEILDGYSNSYFFDSFDSKKLSEIMEKILNADYVYHSKNKVCITDHNVSLLDCVLSEIENK